MPIYTEPYLGTRQQLDLEDYQPGIGEVMSASWDSAMSMNPMRILTRRHEMMGWDEGPGLTDAMSSLDPTADIDFEAFHEEAKRNAVPVEAQEQQFRDAGLEGQLKAVEGYRQEALNILIENKHLENALAHLNEKTGAMGTFAGFVAGMGASFLDPINIASAFVPVVGEARMMSLMAGAGSMGKRAAIRAEVGALSGAAGAAMIEPMVYMGQQEVQADYTFANSLLNAAFGAVLGGVLHSTGGTLAEWRRAKKDVAHPWAYIPPDDDSRALMQAHADELGRAVLDARPEMDPELVSQGAQAYAALFDSKARTWAFNEKKTVGEYYALRKPQYRSWQAPFETSLDGPDGFGWHSMDAQQSQTGDILKQLAWHGSPYRFNKFSLKNIGTGEGAQAHGWGLYFAADKNVGENYRISYADTKYFAGARELRGDEAWAASFLLDEDGKRVSLEDALKKIEKITRQGERRESIIKSIHALDQENLRMDEGQLYQVGVPENDVLLDENIVFEKQPENVRNLLKDEGDFTGKTGREIYKEIKNRLGSPKAASQHLNSLGIKGITYEGRDDGRCFVIFDDRTIKITDTLYHSVIETNLSDSQPTAKIIDIQQDSMRHEDGTPVNLFSREDVFKWLQNNLQGKIVKIDDDGTIQKFLGRTLDASLKRRGKEHKEIYVELETLLKNAKFDKFIEADTRHKDKVKGQNIYYGAARIGEQIYSVRIKIDIPNKKAWPTYKDHKLTEIEIAPSLYPATPGNNTLGRQNNSAITRISLDALKGSVKPSKVENGVLYQSVEATPESAKPLPERFAEMGFVEVRGERLKSLAGAREWAKKNFGTDKAVINADTGDKIFITTKGVRDTIAHGFDDNLAKTIPVLPDIIRTGLYLGEYPKKTTLKSHIYANKIRMEGKNYVVGFVVREDANGKRFYDHELTEVIDPDLLQHVQEPNREATGYVARANRGDVMNILREELGVNNGAGKILFQSSPAVIGKKTQILGANSRETGRYEVRELDDIIASHDPENQFRKRANYPEQAQERPYHTDPGEQQKVIGNALSYEPAFVISTDPTAANGPPIITQSGIVLGGNSRTMTLQLIYGQHPDKVAAYRQALAENAEQFGIDPKAVAGMKKPMLVRVVSGQLSPEEMARRSREYNQSMTQVLQAEAEGISRARFVDRAAIDALIEGLRDGNSIEQFLASPASADFAGILQDAGVLQQSEISSLTHSGRGQSGKLNDAGKALVMQIMRGLVLPDYDVMTGLPKGVLKNLDAAIPGLALSRFQGGGFDLSGAFYEAMRFVARANKEGTPVEQQFFQHSLTSADPYQDNAAVQVLAMTFANADPKEIRLRMEHYTRLADTKNEGQNTLMPGMGMSPESAFRKAFLEDLVFVGNERIANFKPDANPRDAAIQWAIQNGGKTPTIEKAQKKIERKLERKKLPQEERASLKEISAELSAMSGPVGIRKPKLGSFWQDPGKIDIPSPKEAGERGALPEKTAGAKKPMSDPDANLSPELEEEPTRIPLGNVSFDPETGQAVVTFFKAANLSTAPHELFHIFRREIEETALSPDASRHAKEQWQRLNEFVGAKEGQRWTEDMEERFANAGLRYLAEGRAPSQGLKGVFERLKQWFMDIFQKAENIGVEISPKMRETFDRMFTVPYDMADRQFRYALGDIHSRLPEAEFADPAASGGKFSEDDQKLLDAEKRGDLQAVEELLDDARVQAEEAAERIEKNSPELRETVNETNAEIAEIDQEIKRVDMRDELRRQALECEMNGG